MPKKHDLPAMPFYFGDWMKCPEVRAMDLEPRMIWFEMLGFMWESTERGYLTLNGNKIDNTMLARMLGITEERLTLALTIMVILRVYSIRKSDGALYCRRMVRDEEIRIKRANGGILGGNPALKVNLKGYPSRKPSAEDENEDENKDINNKSFNEFWEKYHSITGLPKTDKEAAIKKYKKLNKTEKQKAADNIENYYSSLKDKNYCKKARTYLNNKNFNDEFKKQEDEGW